MDTIKSGPQPNSFVASFWDILKANKDTVKELTSEMPLIELQRNRPMSMKRLAVSVGMSVTSFDRHFKTVTGKSPLAYQRHIRLLEAQRLITTGVTNITAAAFATGYASSSLFSRKFKRIFGIPQFKTSLSWGDVHVR